MYHAHVAPGRWLYDLGTECSEQDGTSLCSLEHSTLARIRRLYLEARDGLKNESRMLQAMTGLTSLSLVTHISSADKARAHPATQLGIHVNEAERFHGVPAAVVTLPVFIASCGKELQAEQPHGMKGQAKPSEHDTCGQTACCLPRRSAKT